MRAVALPSLLGLLAFALVACGHRYPSPPYSPQPTSALVPVPIEPPPARAERVPPRPSDRAVWIDGEWSWRRRRWVWTPGRWVEPPSGLTYSPWVTVRGADGTLYFAPSAWRTARGETAPAPRALAVANVESGAVVDPEGDPERTIVVRPQ
jgi:hypothetical protein